jgi:hypothetical protein
MAENIYDFGDLVRLAATFTNVLGTVAEPSLIMFHMMSPDWSCCVVVVLCGGVHGRERLDQQGGYRLLLRRLEHRCGRQAHVPVPGNGCRSGCGRSDVPRQGFTLPVMPVTVADRSPDVAISDIVGGPGYEALILAHPSVVFYAPGSIHSGKDIKGGVGVASTSGVPTSDPTKLLALSGGSVDFDQSPGDGLGYGDILDSTLVGNTPYSVELWMMGKAGATAACRLFSKTKGAADVTERIEILWNGQNSPASFQSVRTVASVNRGTVGPANKANGIVYHVVMTYDGTATRIYVNGVLDSTGAADANATTVLDSTLMIGRAANGSNSMQGYISNVAIYNIALDLATIGAHYSTGVGGPGTVASVSDVAPGCALSDISL